jgi:hypothetical protein
MAISSFIWKKYATVTASQNKAGMRLAKRFRWKSGVKAQFIHNVAKLFSIIR